jgi:plastocyanin
VKGVPVVAATIVLAVALVLVAAAPAAAPGGGAVRDVTMPGKVYAPGRLQVLAGDTVVWRNADATNHTVTSDDDVFDSGYIGPGLTFSRAFVKTGLYRYHCTIHRFMRGEVVVVPVALSAPASSVVSGGRVVLNGLAPTGTARVTLVRLGRGGKVVARAVPAGDGSFTVTLHAYLPADLVARANGASSPHIHVAVAPKVGIRRGGEGVVSRTTPARPGARAAFQRYDRGHFTWRTIARDRLDRASRVSFALPDRLGRYRVVVRGDHGWADGVSGTVVVAQR